MPVAAFFALTEAPGTDAPELSVTMPVMVAVAASEQHVQQLLHGGQGVSLAAVNGPESVVISGEHDSVAALVSQLVAQGYQTTPLAVSHAFHSPLIDPILEQLRVVAHGVRYQPPTIPIISTVTGQLASTEQLCSPEYWVDQARQTVRFADAITAVHHQPVSVLLELGPDATLSAMAQHSLGDQPGLAAVAITRRDRPEPVTAITAMAELFVRGVPVDWAALVGSGQRVVLPTYPFQRQRFWLDATAPAGVLGVGLDSVEHPVLGAVVEVPESGGVVVA